MESRSSCGSIGELGLQENSMKVVVVGYALTSKKIKSFLQPKLEGLARNKGIYFVATDQTWPLSAQCLFGIILHKMSGKEWQQILEVNVNLTIFYIAILFGKNKLAGCPWRLITGNFLICKEIQSF